VRKAGTYIHDRAGEAPRPAAHPRPRPAAPEATGLRPATVSAPVETATDDAPADTGRRANKKKEG
jgi:hypothetical protein